MGWKNAQKTLLRSGGQENVQRTKITNKQNRNRLIGTESRLMIARWEGAGELGDKGEGIKKYKLVVKNRHGEVKYSIGNVVNNVMSTYVTR